VSDIDLWVGTNLWRRALALEEMKDMVRKSFLPSRVSILIVTLERKEK